jgi:hypothetical protein
MCLSHTKEICQRSKSHSEVRFVRNETPTDIVKHCVFTQNVGISDNGQGRMLKVRYQIENMIINHLVVIDYKIKI